MFKIITLVDRGDPSNKPRSTWASMGAFPSNLEPDVHIEDQVYDFQIGDVFDPSGGDKIAPLSPHRLPL